jgi:hypothetical protein
LQCRPGDQSFTFDANERDFDNEPMIIAGRGSTADTKPKGKREFNVANSTRRNPVILRSVLRQEILRLSRV